METEIKLLLSPASRATVEAHPALAAASPRGEEMASIYYDTPDHALRARGVTLRVRRAGDRWVQTVKSAAGGTGLGSRGEWEWPIPSGTLDEGALRRGPESARLIGDDIDRLGPVFSTHVTRISRDLTLDGRTTVEVALDAGEIRAGERRSPVAELEVELKGGPLAPMLRLAAELSRDAGLRIGTDSKSERGYALLAAEPPAPPPEAEVELPPRATLGEAFPLLLNACLRSLAARLGAAARGDVEGVHGLRAAIRRARTLLTLFAPHLDASGARRFDSELRELARLLGAGRDWDVFSTETLAEAEGEIGREAADALRAAAAARRGEAQAEVRSVLEGPSPTRLLLGLALWVSEPRWLDDGRDAGARFGDLVPGLLGRLERRAAKRGRHLRSLDVEDLHGLRKSLKKLRYACEDVGSMFEGDAVRPYVGGVKKVLADLGEINDAAVTEQRVDDLGAEGGTAPATALLAWNARRRRAAERSLRRHWRKLRHADPFWT